MPLAVKFHQRIENQNTNDRHVASLVECRHVAGRDSIALAVFSALILAMIFLQKLGFTVGDASVGFDWFLIWGGYGLLLLLGVAQFQQREFLVFLALVFVTLAGQALIGASSRPSAIALLLLAYAPFAIQVRVSGETFRRCLSVFQGAMAVIAVVVIMQQIAQYSIGSAYWPNLDRMLPSDLLYPGFAYLRPYSWDPQHLTPNGIVFLEPSVFPIIWLWQSPLS
jgi:hypothetical protein